MVGPRIGNMDRSANHTERCRSNRELFSNFRERLLQFIFSLDDMDSIQAPAQHNLLKRNLGCAQTLVQIVSFNIDSVEEEMKFMFTKECC